MIAVEELRFAYGPGGPELFGGLTHRFAPGAVTAVTGASGRGKSTLLYLLGLMLTPTGGRVRVDGEAVSALPDGLRSRLRAARVGFVFQDAALDDSRTVAANVAEGALYAGLPAGAVRAEARGLLDRFGVRLRESGRPGEVSGGQAQRVALCRALVKSPDLLLADEPTGNLDADSAATVWQALVEAANRGATVVLATHAPSLVQEADDILAL